MQMMERLINCRNSLLWMVWVHTSHMGPHDDKLHEHLFARNTLGVCRWGGGNDNLLLPLPLGSLQVYYPN